MFTIQQSLKISTEKLKQKNIPSSSLDAEVLLLEALNKNRAWLYLNNNYKLNKNEEKLFNDFINQRLENKPVAYIINKKEFYGYDFYVNENVLIPRPETELIVEEVLKVLNNVKYCSGQAYLSATIFDIGAGSGCILISILNELAKNKENKIIYKAYANDISKKAIAVAKINTRKYNLNKKIKFITGDLEKVITEKIFLNSNQIIITANLPYIKNSAYENLSANVKKYEPEIALRAGENGLGYIEKLINLISKIKIKSNQKIHLFLEADPEQMSKISAISRKKLGNIDIEIIKDLSGKERIVKLLYLLRLTGFPPPRE